MRHGVPEDDGRDERGDADGVSHRCGQMAAETRTLSRTEPNASVEYSECSATGWPMARSAGTRCAHTHAVSPQSMKVTPIQPPDTDETTPSRHLLAVAAAMRS